MIQFLIRYRRSTGELLQVEELGPDRHAAMERRIQEESDTKNDGDVEVVLLTASSRNELMHTHARYFKTVHDLASDLAEALPKGPKANRNAKKNKQGGH